MSPLASAAIVGTVSDSVFKIGDLLVGVFNKSVFSSELGHVIRARGSFSEVAESVGFKMFWCKCAGFLGTLGDNGGERLLNFAVLATLSSTFKTSAAIVGTVSDLVFKIGDLLVGDFNKSVFSSELECVICTPGSFLEVGESAICEVFRFNCKCGGFLGTLGDNGGDRLFNFTVLDTLSSTTFKISLSEFTVIVGMLSDFVFKIGDLLVGEFNKSRFSSELEYAL
ncbi:hypothetical protein NQD34_005839 [Periophthalmus magnuspinnatus]|nr:hypothetical protein NQD34_005839 [Periophthalmus magnuspinnatus]